MQFPQHSRSFNSCASALIGASMVLASTQVTAQQNELTQPATPRIELLEEFDFEISRKTEASEATVLLSTVNLSKRQELLSSPNRVGYGAATTGGSNEVVISNIEEFIAAVSQPDNYILLAPSLAGQTLLISEPIRITGENITIDGSNAPGAVFRPTSGYPNNQPLMTSYAANFIINEVTLDGGWYPDKSTFNNVAAIRFFGDGIWANKVTVTGFWDDAFDVVISATNATFSNIKTFLTNKSIHGFYPHSSDRNVSLHSSQLSARERNPWNQGARNFHMWNNYIHDDPSFPYFTGTYVGNSISGYAANGMTQSGPANVISEHNVFEGLYPFLIFGDNPPSIVGFVHSNHDSLGGGRIGDSGTPNGGVSNFTVTLNPSLFTIPYKYDLLPTSQVKAYVLANAGASVN